MTDWESRLIARPGLTLGCVLAALIVWRLLAARDAGLNLSIDEAQYFIWSLDPAWGYFSKPPLIAWTIAGAGLLCGDSETCIRLPALLLFTGTAWVMAALANRLFDARTGMWVGIAFATTLLSSFYARFMTTDGLLLFCWALALLLFLRALETDRWRDWLGLAVAIGFGLLAKYTMVIFLLCALAVLWVDHRPRIGRKAAVAALLGLAFLIPNVLWNQEHHFATLRHTAELTQLDRELLRPASLANFVLAQFAIMGPLLLPALLVAAADRQAWRSDARQRFLVLFSLPILAGFLLLSFLTRANANWGATTYVAATVLAVAMLLQRNHRRWLAWAIIINLLLAAALYHWQRLAPALGVPLAPATDPFHAVRGWDTSGRQLAEQMRATGCHAVISSDRGTLVELAYYARRNLAVPVTPLAYNPGGIPRNHFDLTADIADRAFDCAILVGRFGEDQVKREFSAAEALPALEVPKKGILQPMSAWRVSGFLGYGGAAAGR